MYRDRCGTVTAEIYNRTLKTPPFSPHPALARRGAPMPRRRSRLESILNGDPAASPLRGAHRLGAPHSSHRAPQRVRLRCFLRLVPCWKSFLSILPNFNPREMKRELLTI